MYIHRVISSLTKSHWRQNRKQKSEPRYNFIKQLRCRTEMQNTGNICVQSIIGIITVCIQININGILIKYFKIDNSNDCRIIYVRLVVLIKTVTYLSLTRTSPWRGMESIPEYQFMDLTLSERIHCSWNELTFPVIN